MPRLLARPEYLAASMPLSPDDAYDRAASKIWRAFLPSMLLPTPLIFFQAWLRQADRIELYLLLSLALFWSAVALPYFLIYSRRGFRTRTIPIPKAPDLFCVPLLFSMRWPADIIKDCGGGTTLRINALIATGVLFALIIFWLRSVVKKYQAALPPEAPAPAPEQSAEQIELKS